LTVASGIVVPARWLNSTRCGFGSTLIAAPLLGLSITGPMLISNDVTRSAGPSPILNCAFAVAAGPPPPGLFIALLVYFPQPSAASNSRRARKVQLLLPNETLDDISVVIMETPKVELSNRETLAEPPQCNEVQSTVDECQCRGNAGRHCLLLVNLLSKYSRPLLLKSSRVSCW